MTIDDAPILVVTCGNVNAGDDGVGPVIAGRLAHLALPEVEVLDVGSAPASLLDKLEGRESLLVIDALRCDALPAGTVLELDATQHQELPFQSRNTFSNHGWGIDRTLGLARRLGCLPHRARILGVSIEQSGLDRGVSVGLHGCAPVLECRVAFERLLIRRVADSSLKLCSKRRPDMFTPVPFEVWSARSDGRPGALLETLEKLAIGEIDPQFLLVRAAPTDPGQMLILMAPVQGELERERATRAGFAPDANWHFVRVEGTDEHGTALRVTEALTEVGVFPDEVLLSVLDSRLVVFLGLRSEADARTAIRRLEHQI